MPGLLASAGLFRSKEVKLLIMSPACAGMDNGKRPDALKKASGRFV